MLSHPCFNEKDHFKVGRIHIPATLRCNIQCRYCDRKLENKTDNMPGMAEKIIDVCQIKDYVDNKVNKNDKIKVIGIAGPGEPLSDEHTFQLLKLIDELYPNYTKCISTNGLILSEKVELLKGYGVNTVTVTINAFTPETAVKIYKYVTINNKIASSLSDMEYFLNKQWEGIEKAVNLGLIVKINSVLIPKINTDEIIMISKKASEYNAYIHNITPLIPAGEFEDIKAPSYIQLKDTRDKSSKYIRVFSLCKQCRADACGIPGEELTILKGL